MTSATYTEGFHDPEAAGRMTYHQLGNTGMEVSRVSLGGGPLGDLYAASLEHEKIDMVHLALKSGINYIDTAPWYGRGRSEEVLGKVHDVEFAESTDLILKETLPALQKVVAQGKARFIGITGYDLSLLKVVVERSTVKIDVVLSYARNTLIDDTLTHFMSFFKSRGLGVVCASAVSMGLLCDAPLASWHPADKEIKDACKDAVAFCRAEGVDVARLAVHHALKLEGVDTHLMGNDSCDILRRNLDSVHTPPTPREAQLAVVVQQRYFTPLTRRHWEGTEVEWYWKTLREAREATADTTTANI